MQARKNKNDLDSSNVLYDEDFEIEDEKVNESNLGFPAAQSSQTDNLFNPR